MLRLGQVGFAPGSTRCAWLPKSGQKCSKMDQRLQGPLKIRLRSSSYERLPLRLAQSYGFASDCSVAPLCPSALRASDFAQQRP